MVEAAQHLSGQAFHPAELRLEVGENLLVGFLASVPDGDAGKLIIDCRQLETFDRDVSENRRRIPFGSFVIDTAPASAGAQTMQLTTSADMSRMKVTLPFCKEPRNGCVFLRKRRGMAYNAPDFSHLEKGSRRHDG